MLPFLGSGPVPNPRGSGFYTVEDYRRILEYAAQRHIQVQHCWCSCWSNDDDKVQHPCVVIGQMMMAKYSTVGIVVGQMMAMLQIRRVS